MNDRATNVTLLRNEQTGTSFPKKAKKDRRYHQPITTSGSVACHTSQDCDSFAVSRVSTGEKKLKE
ncbi:MAG: hypothetical protein ACJ8AG_25460 [Ktedonobacteraceae bacterium]